MADSSDVESTVPSLHGRSFILVKVKVARGFIFVCPWKGELGSEFLFVILRIGSLGLVATFIDLKRKKIMNTEF